MATDTRERAIMVNLNMQEVGRVGRIGARVHYRALRKSFSRHEARMISGAWLSGAAFYARHGGAA
jgi:hypothetical protein